MRSAALALLMLAAPPALAQEGAAASPPKKAKRVLRIDILTIEGRVQKPQAFYILQRSNVNFDDLQRPESFVPKVVKSVDKEPF